MDSKEVFNAIKSSQIKLSDVKNKQNEFLNELSNIKIGKKTAEQKEVIKNLEKFYNSREEVKLSEVKNKQNDFLINDKVAYENIRKITTG